MIGDSNSAMSPIVSALDKVSGGSHSVHLRHIGVQVKLNTLLLCPVRNYVLVHHADNGRAENIVVLVLIILERALYQKAYAWEKVTDPPCFAHGNIHLQLGRVGVIGDKYIDTQLVPCACRVGIDLEYLAPNYTVAKVGTEALD